MRFTHHLKVCLERGLSKNLRRTNKTRGGSLDKCLKVLTYCMVLVEIETDAPNVVSLLTSVDNDTISTI